MNIEENRKQLLEETELFVLDMDGTVYFDETLIDGALDFLHILEEQKKQYLFFTNNSSRRPMEYVKRLRRLGCDVGRDKLMTSADVTVAYLKKFHPGAPVYLIGTPELVEDFREQGICVTEEEAPIVLVAFDKTLTYEKLEKGCSMIRNGAMFLSTHPDINCPVEGGFIPDCGAICAAISLSTGKTPKYLGKPYKETAQMIQEKTKVPMERVAFVGDRLYTDVATGVNHGGKGILVLSGETKRSDLDVSDIKPDGVFESLGEMAVYLHS